MFSVFLIGGKKNLSWIINADSKIDFVSIVILISVMLFTSMFYFLIWELDILLLIWWYFIRNVLKTWRENMNFYSFLVQVPRSILDCTCTCSHGIVCRFFFTLSMVMAYFLKGFTRALTMPGVTLLQFLLCQSNFILIILIIFHRWVGTVKYYLIIEWKLWSPRI